MFIIADSRTWIAPNPRSVPEYFLPQLNRANFPKRYIPNLHKITRILRKIKPDLVHLHAQYHYSPAILLTRTPYILTSWGTEVLTLPKANIIIKTLAKTAASKASKITVDARLLQDIWTRIGIPNNKIQLIPFGVNLNSFNPNTNGSTIRKKLGIQEDDIALISTRALRNHHYNIETFIKAMPLILKSIKNAKFIVKGTGPLESHLRNLAKRLNVSDKVAFIGLVPHAELANYLAAADIYVSTCITDTTSVSLLEAMACGLAPIVTDIPGNREWITNKENGLLFQPENHEDLAEKTIQLIENEQLRKQFGDKCYNKVRRKASWENCVTRMERIYQEAIQAKA